MDAESLEKRLSPGTRPEWRSFSAAGLFVHRFQDLVLLRADSVFLRPLADPVKALVYAETGGAIDTVLVDGRVVLERGRVTTVDEDRRIVVFNHAAETMFGYTRSHILKEPVGRLLVDDVHESPQRDPVRLGSPPTIARARRSSP